LGIGPHSSCIVYCVVHITVGIESTPCFCVTDTIRSDFFAARAVEKRVQVWSQKSVSCTRKGCLKMRERKVPDRLSINLKPYICPKYTVITVDISTLIYATPSIVRFMTTLRANYIESSSFCATICKTVRPMLSDRCLSVYPVCLSRQCTVAKPLDGSR